MACYFVIFVMVQGREIVKEFGNVSAVVIIFCLIPAILILTVLVPITFPCYVMAANVRELTDQVKKLYLKKIIF